MWLVAVALLAAPALQVGVRSGEGLTIGLDGIPLVAGSAFQYYESGWTKGYYSSNRGEQRIETTPEGRRLTFRSDDGRAHGTQSFAIGPNRVTVRSEFHWAGDGSVNVELTGGLIWAPVVAAGTLSIDGRPTRPLSATRYPSPAMSAERRYGEGLAYVFDAPVGRLTVTADGPGFQVFDGRGYDQDWAAGRDLLWLGSLGIPVSRGRPAVTTLEFRFEPAADHGRTSRVVLAEIKPLAQALLPSVPLPILPKPKEMALSKNRDLVLGTPVWPRVGGGRPGLERALAQDFGNLISARWSAPKAVGKTRIEARIADLRLPPEAYAIAVTNRGVALTGQDEAGLRHGARTLAKLARPRKGRLVLPVGTVRDWPSTAWRGVHLFVGPKAFELHRRLFDRVLGPLGYNKAVLQCERTDWKATPGIATAITTPRDRLAAEFTWLRDRGIEPIPLIQSFGHMEWLFANGKNRDLAQNQAVPYAVDVTNPATRTLLEAIWTEAVALLRPATIHFGLDEVDMLGYPDDPELVTRHWERHLPWLGELAAKLDVRPMLWGDKALAPGEAVDATLGHSPAHAARRRAVIPLDAIIADWHYRAEQNPEPFRTSLRLWRDSGRFAVASAWYRPENVRGFALAARREFAGYLQTTWAGYESSEENLLREFGQFAAMVLAADYAWGGRDEAIEDLPYDATEVLGQMLFGEPGQVAPVAGLGFFAGPERRLGRFAFRLGRPVALVNRLTKEGASRPTSLVFELRRPVRGQGLALACSAETVLAAGSEIARVEIGYAAGPVATRELRYGWHVREPEDRKGLVFGERASGLSIVSIPVDPNRPVSRVRIVATAPQAGFTVHGATAIGTAR